MRSGRGIIPGTGHPQFQLLLPIPLAPVLDRRSGIRTDATTNSKACSSKNLTSKMTYSIVIAVTRTAVLIKEGSVFCIALNEKAYLFPCLSWLDKPYLLPSCHHSCSTLKQASVSGFPGCSRCCSTVSVARGLPLRETIDR